MLSILLSNQELITMELIDLVNCTHTFYWYDMIYFITKVISDL